MAIAKACKSPDVQIAATKNKLSWIMLHEKLASILQDKQSKCNKIWDSLLRYQQINEGTVVGYWSPPLEELLTGADPHYFHLCFLLFSFFSPSFFHSPHLCLWIVHYVFLQGLNPWTYVPIGYIYLLLYQLIVNGLFHFEVG